MRRGPGQPGEIKKGIKVYPIKTQRMAETDLGPKIVTNIVILAFFTALTQAVPKDAMAKTIKTSVPKGTIDLNLKAFERGCDAYGEGTGEQVEEGSGARSGAE
jgi:2-oxoglutarate ferredoxin oxidoreductase subunit gamma